MPRYELPIELILEMASAKFKPLTEGRGPLSYREVAELHKRDLAKIQAKISTKGVERAILNAFKQHWITIERKRIIPHYRRDTRREERLLRAFNRPQKQLNNAIVVDIIESRRISLRELPSDARRRHSGSVHEQLGHALATEIANANRLFRPRGDIVSVGSGRATHDVIDSLRQFPHFKVNEITIMSLTGSLFIHETDVRQEFLLDADIHTALLAQRFDGRVHTLPITYSIAHEPNVLSTIKTKTTLGRGYENNTPTHAIVGVGVLALGHRFFEEVKRRDKERKSEVPHSGAAPTRPSTLPDAVLADLRWLISQSETINARCQTYWPIADVCNRLFFVLPPKSLHVPNEKEIRDCIDRVNSCLLTITKTQLDKVATVMLVAGTLPKARAIFDLLVRPIPKIDTLCVDSQTADEILRMA